MAIDASSASSGGAVRFLSQIGPALSEARPDITYYLLNRAEQRARLPSQLPHNFTWVQIPDSTCSVPRRLLWLQTRLPGILKELQADVLLAASDVTTLRSPYPTVLMVHNFNPFAPSRGQLWTRGQRARMAVHRWLIRRCARKASRVLFVSQWSQQQIAPQLGIPAERCDVMYHGVDAGFISAPDCKEAETGREFALIVSEVLEHKNLQRAVEAYRELVEQTGIRLDLVIAGTVTSQSLKQELEQSLEARGLRDRVTFAGWVSTEELASLYRLAEFLLFPSLVETFGLPLIEAMASGLPVVASNASAIPEICQDAAGYFDPLDVTAMTQAMKRVLTDQEFSDSLRRKGLARASEFTWESTSQQLLYNLELTCSAAAPG